MFQPKIKREKKEEKKSCLKVIESKNSTAWNQINNAPNILFEFDFLISFSIISTLPHRIPFYITLLFYSPSSWFFFLIIFFSIFARDYDIGNRPCNACVCKHFGFSIFVAVLFRLSEHRFMFTSFHSTCRYICCFWQNTNHSWQQHHRQ